MSIIILSLFVRLKQDKGSFQEHRAVNEVVPVYLFSPPKFTFKRALAFLLNLVKKGKLPKRQKNRI